MSEMPEVELWTAEEKAEFLLNNSFNEQEYREAIEESIKLGVDPTKLEHLIQDEPWARPELYVDSFPVQRTS